VTNAYPQIAGQSVSRLEAISDGIFAVAMTLLVLDLAIKGTTVPHGQHPLWTAGAGSEHEALRELRGLAPKVVPYVMSFMTLGIFWVGQQTQLNHIERANRQLTYIHLAFLSAITLMPFSTRFLSVAAPAYLRVPVVLPAGFGPVGGQHLRQPRRVRGGAAGGDHLPAGTAVQPDLIRIPALPERAAG